jgi:hypothetical protein
MTALVAHGAWARQVWPSVQRGYLACGIGEGTSTYLAGNYSPVNKLWPMKLLGPHLYYKVKQMKVGQ